MNWSVHQNAETSKTRNIETLKLAVGTLTRGYDELDRSLESINLRAGLSLTLFATVLPALSFRVDASVIKGFDNHWGVPAIIYFLSFISILVGIIRLVLALNTRSMPAAFSKDDIINENDEKAEYKKSEYDYLCKEMVNLADAIDKRKSIAAEKSEEFNNGIVCVLLGIGFLLLLQVVGSLFSLNQ